MQIKKSAKASLEGDKLIYVLMGFVFVLSLCFVALVLGPPLCYSARLNLLCSKLSA